MPVPKQNYHRWCKALQQELNESEVNVGTYYHPCMRTKIEIIVPRMTDFVVYDSSYNLSIQICGTILRTNVKIQQNHLMETKVKLLSKGLPGGTLFSGDPDWKNFVW